MGNKQAKEEEEVAAMWIETGEDNEEKKPVFSRMSRIDCYKHRDAFYLCLDENDEHICIKNNYYNKKN